MRIRVWDAPLRLFHWVLATLVVFSYVTGQLGGSWLTWHMRSGFAILALLGFRIAWGFVGSDTARFSSFLRPPVVGWRYLRETARGRLPRVVGHNPLGAWMVVLMLLLLLVQAASGLFADDEIATQGPLAVKVPDAWVSRMSTLHYYNQYIVLAAVLLHVVAIAVYWKVLRVNLVKPMVDGSVETELAPGEALPRMRSSALALALLAVSAAAVYALVVLYPGAP